MTVVTVLHQFADPSYQCIADSKLESAAVKPRLKQTQPVSKTIDTAFAQEVVQRGVKRTRKSHNKVRTGCLTCKVRKKKCDEARPACTRCTSTGRKCDGYDAPEVPTTTTSHDAQESLPVTYLVECEQVSYNHVSEEPRVIELDVNVEDAKVLLKADDIVDEAEVTDFILSYATQPPPEGLGHSSPHTNSTSSGLSCLPHSPRSYNYKATLPRSPNFFSPTTEISSVDASCFSYFKHVTGPSFASYFDSSLWRTYAASAALAHPVVFSAATALGAVHQRFNHGISREAFEYCGHAARLHSRAVRQLEELKSQHVNQGMLGTSSPGGQGMGVYDRDVIMTSEMLLGLFEGFQQNYAESVAHMNNGMKYLLARPMTLIHTESSHFAVEPTTKVFQKLFDQLKQRALHLFGSETKILVSRGGESTLPVIPDVFSDLDEARDFLFTEVYWIMHSPEEAWSDLHGRGEAQSLHVERLMKWSVSYAETMKDMRRTPQQKVACKLMKTTRNATHLLLFMTLFNRVDFELPEPRALNGSKDMSDDDSSNPFTREKCSQPIHSTQEIWSMVQSRNFLTTHIARLKILAESILNDSSLFQYDEHSVSFDSAVGPPLRNDRMPNSSAKTRHLVKTFLKDSPKSSALWEMLGVYGVAEKISAVEEHAVIAAIRDIIPEHIDPKWVDITCLMESRKILLRYCRPDEHGLGMIWTQEWWAF